MKEEFRIQLSRDELVQAVSEFVSRTSHAWLKTHYTITSFALPTADSGPFEFVATAKPTEAPAPKPPRKHRTTSKRHGLGTNPLSNGEAGIEQAASI